MSRCFPYPPPGYERKIVVRDEALIESIKIQREREKAKKEKRREKKKKEKKEKKEKLKENGEIEKKKHKHKKRHRDGGSKVDKKGGDHPKRKEDETEQLEKSGLTEELGRPASAQNLYDSSDSTQNSSKRKKNSSPSDGSHNHGSMLRIRLPLLKHKNPEVPPSQEQACLTSGRTEIVAREKAETATGPRKEQPCSTSGRKETPAQDKSQPAARSRFFESGCCAIESQLVDLIENWVPPPIQSEITDFDDQEWLFGTKQQPGMREAKRFKASNDVSCHGSSSLWPRAHYLPKADIYALPYTIPY